MKGGFTVNTHFPTLRSGKVLPDNPLVPVVLPGWLGRALSVSEDPVRPVPV